MCIFAIVLAGCGHEQVRRVPDNGATLTKSRVPPGSVRQSPGEYAAVAAVGQVGTPYVYGGSTVRGFDCSGLVQYAWKRAGRYIPRTTGEQWRRLQPVSDRELRAGDLLFFRIDGRISHVGMYLGERRFVHAPSTGQEVSVASLDSDFYRRTFVRGARPD